MSEAALAATSAGSSGQSTQSSPTQTVVGKASDSATGQTSNKSKKRKFDPPVNDRSIPPNVIHVGNIEVLHQKTCLSFYLHRSPPTADSQACSWFANGMTTLYLQTDKDPAEKAGTGTATTNDDGRTTSQTGHDETIQLALNLRGTCHVTSVSVETVELSSQGNDDESKNLAPKLQTMETTFQHFDPLQRILLKPARSYTMDDVVQLAEAEKPSAKPHDRRHQADSQFHRHAIGMTSALRAASIASNMGELRITAERKTINETTKETSSADRTLVTPVEEVWKEDLLEHSSGGDVQRRLTEKLSNRSSTRKTNRIDFIASRLADTSKKNSVKVTVFYKIELGNVPTESGNGQDVPTTNHMGGIHVIAKADTPHVYTTAGVIGDHEGPRSWIPILDSASTKHRSSHDITIKLTAPMKDGLSVVGFGEDFGASECMLHDKLTRSPPNASLVSPSVKQLESMKREIGNDTVSWLEECLRTAEKYVDGTDEQNLHIIPPETSQISTNITSLDSIMTTSVWSSSSWLPISPRSLGFAIGPFRVLDDPEYINSVLDEDDDQSFNEAEGDDDKDESRRDQGQENNNDGDDIEDDDSIDAVERTRANGEGIRQAYFAPIFARKHIHATGSNMSLMPDTSFSLTPLTQRQQEMCDELDRSVLTTTVGVPHRALSMMRDVLALPAFRTVSYTQIWIPNAVHGGATSGPLHDCPEVLCNPFLGGSIMDARLLPPPNYRLPYHLGGRPLQFLQARCAVRGWITSAIPLAGSDDVGQGYIHQLIESFIMSLYERGHGAQGEGGAEGGVYFSNRFSSKSGLNSSNLDFLPVQNIEDTDFEDVDGILSSVPLEDRNNDQLWRSAKSGTESHTSATDEFAIRQLLTLDSVNALERNVEGGKTVPQPSMGWMGSFLSLSFLSSNANSSSDLGCGAVELQHPTGGLPYRVLKCDLLRRIIEGRAGIANFVRLVRATFIAAHLSDIGKGELKYPPDKKSLMAEPVRSKNNEKEPEKDEAIERPKPRFIVCVNEILRKGGLSHTLFTRALQNLSGRAREALLLGTLVDVERSQRDPRTGKAFVDPEGFPNSYVRGASELYLRVGVFVEPSTNTSGNVVKGVQLQSYAEPVIPEGGTAFGGPITLRVVENQGALQEVTKDLAPDGSRRDWERLTLHANPVTDKKTQTAASGSIDNDGPGGISKRGTELTGGRPQRSAKTRRLGMSGFTARAFTESNIHKNGYQALELVRLTNLTPLLWIRVDPMAHYGGRIYVSQPDACLAEMAFHDGDAGAQVEALRALSERPVKIQGSVKISSVHDVDINELPVRVLGDCLRGSPALHSDLPHTPAVRAQAAYALAQWQNNKAPLNRTDTGVSTWLGLDLLIQYFFERFYNNGTVMPIKFSRVTIKMNELNQGSQSEGGNQAMKAIEDDGCRYLDALEEGADRAEALEEADLVEVEEDEEYRVRSAVISAISCIRAKDGMTPPGALTFLEEVLESVDAETVGGNVVSPDEEILMGKKLQNADNATDAEGLLDDFIVTSLPCASSMVVADSLLALCNINVSPSLIMDPKSGKVVQSTVRHPVSKLAEICRRWLDWELYRERIRSQVESDTVTGVSGVCYDSIAACAVTALSSLSILRQSTTDPKVETAPDSDDNESMRREKLEEVATADFYIKIFNTSHTDVTKAACAQAICMVCCAADRLDTSSRRPVGLLSGLEFLLSRIVDRTTSAGLRHTLATLMLDSCTGKVGSVQRVGIVGGRNDLISSSARLYNGPLGSAAGNDVGASVVNTVSAELFPAANAVNDGARKGLRFLKHAGHPREPIDEETLVRIAVFASNLWRTINGEAIELHRSIQGVFNGSSGVCANDGQLRCTLISLWQWLWPKTCMAILLVQTRSVSSWTKDIKDLGVDKVIKTSVEEETESFQEERLLSDMKNRVTQEIDRQIWRGEMSREAYQIHRSGPKPSTVSDLTKQGVNDPLPTIERDKAFKSGGWVSSAAQQRRARNLDGGQSVKVRIRKSQSD